MEKKKPIFKVIVAGGRKFNDYNLLKNKLDNILSEKRKTHQIKYYPVYSSVNYNH